jgi:hypothetical protein
MVLAMSSSQNTAGVNHSLKNSRKSSECPDADAPLSSVRFSFIVVSFRAFSENKLSLWTAVVGRARFFQSFRTNGKAEDEEVD